MHTVTSSQPVFIPHRWGNLLTEAKESLKEGLELQGVASSYHYRKLARSYVSVDICRHLQDMVHTHPGYFFPKKLPEKLPSLSVSLRPDNTYWVISGDDVPQFPDALKDPICFPREETPWLEAYSYPVAVDIRDAESFDPSSFYTATCELLSAAEEWLIECLFRLSEKTPLSDILSVFYRNDKNRFLLKDALVVFMAKGVGSYMLPWNVARTGFRRMQRRLGNNRAIVSAAEINSVVLPQSFSFFRFLQGDAGHIKELNLDEATSLYSSENPLYNDAEHVVYNKRLISIRRLVGGNNSLFSLYIVCPSGPLDTSNLFDSLKAELSRQFTNFTNSSAIEPFVMAGKHIERQFENGDRFAHVPPYVTYNSSRFSNAQALPSGLACPLPPPSVTPDVPPIFPEDLDSIENRFKNGRVPFLRKEPEPLEPCPSPLPEKPNRIGPLTEQQKEAVDHHINDIRKALDENGLAFPSREAESTFINTVRESTHQYTQEILHTADAVHVDGETETEEQEDEWPEFLPPLPDPGDDYPKYLIRTDAYKFLENSVWAKYLKHFNPELKRDYLNQRELEKRDSSLKHALWNQRVRIQKDHEVTTSEILPPSKTRPGAGRKVSSKVVNLPMDEFRKMASLVLSKNRYLKKKRLGIANEP